MSERRWAAAGNLALGIGAAALTAWLWPLGLHLETYEPHRSGQSIAETVPGADRRQSVSRFPDAPAVRANAGLRTLRGPVAGRGSHARLGRSGRRTRHRTVPPSRTTEFAGGRNGCRAGRWAGCDWTSFALGKDRGTTFGPVPKAPPFGAGTRGRSGRQPWRPMANGAALNCGWARPAWRPIPERGSLGERGPAR